MGLVDATSRGKPSGAHRNVRSANGSARLAFWHGMWHGIERFLNKELRRVGFVSRFDSRVYVLA